MKNFFVFNEGFSKSKTASYILSLQLGKNGYSYVIVDTAGGRYAAVNHHNFDKKLSDKSIVEKAESMLKEDLFLSKNYNTVFFSMVESKSTLVPKELFDRKQIKKYFTFNQPLGEYEELHFNYIKKADAYNIFAIPSDITTLMVNKFPEVIFVHQNNIFVKDIISRAENLKFKLPYIQINVNPNSFEIGIYMNDKFQMINTYNYDNENDFIYYVLNTINQYDIKLNKAYINFSGFVEKDTEFYYFIHQYLPKINFLKLNTGLVFNFKDVEEHLFYNLLNFHNEDY